MAVRARARTQAAVMRPALVAVVMAGIAGCSGTTPPAWQARAQGALEAHVAAALSGRDKAAAQELAAARREVARTGDAAQMARVELTACAVRFASLAEPGCPAFAPLARDADAAARAYADYLAGREADPALLPPAQARAWRAADPVAALRAIEDPLSRLVAAARLFRAGRLPPAGIELAIDTASAQGWARPLVAWLGVDRERRAQAGDAEGAAARSRAIERVLGGK